MGQVGAGGVMGARIPAGANLCFLRVLRFFGACRAVSARALELRETEWARE